jgi:hypothetical protein
VRWVLVPEGDKDVRQYLTTISHGQWQDRGNILLEQLVDNSVVSESTELSLARAIVEMRDAIAAMRKTIDALTYSSPY